MQVKVRFTNPTYISSETNNPDFIMMALMP